MMNPMMGGGDENIFQPSQFFYLLGMHQYAPYLGSGINKSYIDRTKSTKRDRDKVDKAIERFHHRGPKANGQIKFRRRVMGNMRSPEQTAGMINAVQPIV